jgi:ribonuclease HII
MKTSYTDDKLEVGMDEVARGSLFGRMYSAAVIWDKNEDSLPHNLRIRDSKKLTPEKRLILSDYIKDYAIDYSVEWVDEKVIDKVNIYQATMQAMHKCLDNLNVEPEYILVDGNSFKPYLSPLSGNWLSHVCIPKGDDTYTSIACASILAKVEHDLYISDICNKYPILDEYYDLKKNMGYGTQNHISGINNYGVSEFHRKSFAPCKDKITLTFHVD